MAGGEAGSAADAAQAQSLGVGQRSHGIGKEQRSTKRGSQALAHDLVVNVEISHQQALLQNNQPGLDHESPDSNGRKKAQMTISPWSMEHQRYFTLTFTPLTDYSLSSTTVQPPGTSHTEHHGASSETSVPVLSSPTSSLHDYSRDLSTATTDKSTKYTPSLALDADLGALSMSHMHTPSTVLQRLNRMKDAMIDSMETPVVAMCHDESLAMANKATLTLMHQQANSASGAPLDLLAKLKFYTENFERELEPEEHPVFRICRSQESFDKLKVGILDSQSRQKRFDVSGETILDEKTGEFLAGIIFMKDITGYAEIIPNQFEAGQQQFEVICDTIPQMVWRVEFDEFRSIRLTLFSQLWMTDPAGMHGMSTS